MSLDIVFQISSLTAIFAWFMLAAGAAVTRVPLRGILLFVSGRVIPLLLCIAYVAILATYWKSAPGGSFASLQGVMKLFASPGKVVGGWLHFLAFDLVVGRWIIDEVLKKKLSRWSLVPCLPLTFMYGPFGLLLYFSIRAAAFRPMSSYKAV